MPDQRPEPESLGELLAHVMDTRGYASLAELARHTTIPYKTLWAWQQGTRNMKRPPAAAILARLAADLGIPEALVFRAAGRTHSEPPLDPEGLEIAHLWRRLTPAERRATERLMRDLLGSRSHEPV